MSAKKQPACTADCLYNTYTKFSETIIPETQDQRYYLIKSDYPKVFPLSTNTPPPYAILPVFRLQSVKVKLPFFMYIT